MAEQDCIFCKIVNGDIPSEEIYNSDNIYGFMDVNPLSEGHCLFIPKKHANKAHEVGDEELSEILIAIKKVVNALGVTNYNILQNNGSIAHQAVDHAHFHMIPKPNNNEGLGIGWKPIENPNQKEVAKKIRKNLKN